MILDRLLGDMPAGQFLDEYYLRLPYSRAGGYREWTVLGSWQVIERILAQPGVDAIVGRLGKQWEGEGPPSAETARRLAAEGYTLGIRHAQRHDAGLAELAAEFRAALAAPIDVHLYCTPAGQPGFGWHYDAEEVFVLQTHGDKEWWLRKNTVNPWPLVETIPQDQRHEREIMPVFRCTLKAGDWLYIPSGYWHKTAAGGESISLSVGVLAPSGIDVLDLARQQLLSSLRWRGRLPAAGAAAPHEEAQRIEQYRNHLAELAADLGRLFSQEQFIRQFVANWPGRVTTA
jgi:ribosomal protein L16 Arg81 hydroxylase